MLRPCSVLAHCLAVLLVWGAVTEVASQQSGQSAGSEETSQPHDRLDVMGTYPVHNRLQCQKLCSYRQLCTSFSYHDNTDQGENCVLHSSHVEDNLVSSPSSPPGWKEQTLSPLTLPDTPADSEGCHTRPCGVQEVCVPSPGEGPGYKCLLMPANCGSPPSVPHATHVHSTTSQGDLATLQCVHSYVASPYQIPVDRQCQVNSRWTNFRGECMQAENLNPELIHVFLLPWQPYDGWQACIEGVFIGPGKMNINFEIGDGNSPMIVAFRDVIRDDRDLLLVSTRYGGRYGNHTEYTEPPMLLTTDDTFSLSFRMNSSHLQMNLNQDQVYDTELTNYPIFGAKTIESWLNVLTYVNLVSACSTR